MEYGFIIHFVAQQNYRPKKPFDIVDVHTHGVIEKWDHPELQIIFNLGSISQEIMGQIIHNAVHLIKNGTVLVPGEEYEEIIEKYKVGIMSPKAGIVRIILPDAEGNTHSEEPSFALQREAEILPPL